MRNGVFYLLLGNITINGIMSANVDVETKKEYEEMPYCMVPQNHVDPVHLLKKRVTITDTFALMVTLFYLMSVIYQ